MNMNKSPETFDPNPLREEDLVFYYSREHRLKRASETVRLLNAPKNQGKKGFFSAILANKAQGFLLISIVVMSAMIMMVSIFTKGDSAVFCGNRVEFSAFRFQETGYLALKKTAGKNPYTGAVNLAVSPSGGDSAETVITRTIFFSLEPEEEYRLMLPFVSDELLILVERESPKEVKTFKVKVK
jgi:hypothetical protein